jgi:adenine-specific DNA-methyltransferase
MNDIYFSWNKKEDCINLVHQQTNKQLIPTPIESINFETTKNIFIEGDNLEALKLLQNEYKEKVKCICIDPPYNINNGICNYKDNYAYSNWLSLMYTKITLSKDLLQENGFIFIFIDDTMFSFLKIICDEVFGNHNFISTIIWERKYAPVNNANNFSKNHDFILCYAKNKKKSKLNLLPRTKESDKRYNKNLDNDPRGNWASSGIECPRENKNCIYEIKDLVGNVYLPNKGRSWAYSQEKFKQLVSDNRIYFGKDGNKKPTIKTFASEVRKGIVPMTIWRHYDVGHSDNAHKELKKLFDGNVYFNYPKPVKLIFKILFLATNKNDLILDFFSGSSTTAHAVMKLNAEDEGNRKYIMVQLPEVCNEESEAYKAGYKTIADIGKERIRRAAKKIKEEYPSYNGDFGFKVIKAC